jgi:hypothetical protein
MFGGAAFTAPGHAGIRTDFMDVEFDDFRLTDPSPSSKKPAPPAVPSPL